MDRGCVTFSHDNNGVTIKRGQNVRFLDEIRHIMKKDSFLMVIFNIYPDPQTDRLRHWWMSCQPGTFREQSREPGSIDALSVRITFCKNMFWGQ